MAKRMGITFFLLVLFIGALGLRILRIPMSAVAEHPGGGMRVTVDESRGAIYDRNGRRLVHVESKQYAAAKPTPAALQALAVVLGAGRLQAAQERMEKGGLLALPVDEAPPACPDITLMEVFPRYGEEQLAPHLIGYLEGSGQGISGLEKSFDNLLAQNAGEAAVRIASDALGRSLAGARPEVLRKNYCSAAGIKLTLDADIQKIAEEAMALHRVAQGAVVVLDAKSGEILAMASEPRFDPKDVAASLHDPMEPFLNRALCAFPVGSTFKCFLAAAALEQNIPEGQCYLCAGEMNVNGQLFHCNKEGGHGLLNMGQALEQSCNLYFVQMAQRLELQPVLDLVALFGFGQQTELAPGLLSAKGNVPALESLGVPAECANFSFGQGTLLCTPLQMAAATACLANGGVYHQPRLVQATVDAAGRESAWIQDTETRQVVAPETAEILRRMMVSTVEHGSGRSAKPETGSAGGKTATAQSGAFDANGSEILQTGFSGFFPAENPRYVITVFRQNGSSGASDCGPVFQRIANAMTAQGFYTIPQ
ncbi:MAG: penicillin-binding protein 2 [Oscillospiraceae bacterium]|jgi:penicillin-binding protein 2|nr:penicillin-binding protein 2 [Oscillospiraceae bacterium]